MQEMNVHADRSQRALVHASRLPWLPSPEPGVERRVLERSGAEVALASSIVRYRAGSRFHAHTHALGEEFLVLEGTFSDERGHYPVGTYVRNPPGSAHAPFSEDGCVIFVKLRQMAADDKEGVTVFRRDQLWMPTGIPGYEQVLLHRAGNVSVTLERIGPGGEIPAHPSPGGEEILVVSGNARLATDDGPLLDTWSWLRWPDEARPALASDAGALLWIKRGHLRLNPTVSV